MSGSPARKSIVDAAPIAEIPAPNAADVLVSSLEAAGVRCVFGVPGGNLVPFYEALSRSTAVRPILCKHEEGGAFMADGYARVSRGLGVCCGIAGPGATHALTGIAGAYCDSLPVLLISGQVATNVFGRGAIQDSTALGIDLVEMFRPVTKLSTMIVNGESTPRIVERALRTALTGRPGPVHLNLPGDIAKARLPHAPPPRSFRHLPATQPSDSELMRAVALLEQAESPAILAGNGVNLVGAWAELRRLAECAGIPVATTPKGKGAFPEDHPLSLGVFGFGGHLRAARHLAGGVDVLLVVGSSLGEFQTNAWDVRLAPSRALIQIDIDPREIGKNYPAEVGLIGDARLSLAALAAELTARNAPPAPATSIPSHLLTIPRYIDEDLAVSNAAPIKPQRVAASLRRVLPDNALVFVDIGNCLSWMIQYFEVREPGTFFLNLGLACMGWSIPAAIGGQLAAPERTVVGVVGDGAFAMMGMEVHTAVEHDLPIVWVVLNDSGFGMVDQGESLMMGRSVSPSRYRHPIDAAAVAQALGAKGFRVDAPDAFEETVREALDLRRPCVIDVRIDPSEVPGTLRMRTDSLRRMFEIGK
jgi:acetolactate synthase-1/2/3 large subunit